MLQSDPDRTRSKKVFVGREVADPSICTGAVDQGLTILSQTTWQDTKPSTKWQLELSGNDRLDKEGFYPPSQKAPSGRAGMNVKRVSTVALAKVDLLRRVPPKR